MKRSICLQLKKNDNCNSTSDATLDAYIAKYKNDVSEFILISILLKPQLSEQIMDSVILIICVQIKISLLILKH